MADLRGTCGTARPVVACVVGVVGEGAAVPFRAGQNFVLNRRRIPNAMNHPPMLVASGLLEEIGAALRLDQRISVKIGEVHRNEGVLRRAQLRVRPIEPRAFADAVTRVDRWLSGTSLSAEIGVPSMTAGADSRRERLTVRVSARKSAEVSAFADTHAGDEESHFGRSWIAAGWRRDALGVELSGRHGL